MNAKFNPRDLNFIAQMVSQIVFGTQPRERKIMHIGRQDCTSPVSCRDMPDPGDRANEL